MEPLPDDLVGLVEQRVFLGAVPVGDLVLDLDEVGAVLGAGVNAAEALGQAGAWGSAYAGCVQRGGDLLHAGEV